MQMVRGLTICVLVHLVSEQIKYNAAPRLILCNGDLERDSRMGGEKSRKMSV